MTSRQDPFTHYAIILAQMPKEAQKLSSIHHSVKKFPLAVITQMLSLATSGFGLVAALAWNSVIQEFVNNYIKKWLPANSGVISLLIYAVAVTVLAVLVTLELTRIKERLEK